MWVVSGPFDDTERKTKVLKCNQQVPVSRTGGAKLFINNKKISRDQGRFIIGAHSDDDVLDPTTIATLEFHFGREGLLKRGENESTAAKGQTIVLYSGDEIGFTKKIWLQVTWVPIVCVTTLNLPVRQCAELGVKLSARPIQQATHYLTDRITLSPPLFAGLLTPAHVVTVGWLNEHLRLAQLPIGLPDGTADGVNPEQTYVPIPEDHYHPGFDDSLPLDMHSALQWNPQATRSNLFSKLRFVILTETARPAGDLVDLITVGGGAYEGFKVQQGSEAFEALLAKLNAKGKSTVGVVPLADTEGMVAALGSAGWKDFVAAANRQGLKFIGPLEIMQATYFVDKKRLDCTFIGHSASSPSLRDYVPSSMPGESQESVPPARRPLRRATSRAPSVTVAPPTLSNATRESVMESQTPAPEGIIPARKLLRRRVKTTVESIMGVDDALASQTPEPLSFREWSAVTDHVLDVPAAPMRNPKLKRRTATQQKEGPEKNPYDISIDGPDEDEEPPLKKFKKMFEDSDPDRLVNTQTQGSEMRTLSSIVELAYEERSEAVQSALRDTSLRKRKRTSDDVDAANEDEETRPRTRADSRTPSLGPPPSKRRAPQMQSAGSLTTVPEVSESQVAPSSSRGAQPQKSQAKSTEKQKKNATQAQPDRDENFLKALASTRKGKKKEDHYDRDFNELRVAKPTQAHLKAGAMVEEDLEAWNAIEKDMDIRGNFMVVMQEIEPRLPQEPEVGMSRAGRPEWVGRSDFKKFKKKNEQSRQEIHRTQPVALVANKIVANGLDLLEDQQGTYEFDDGFEDDLPVKGKGKGRATSRQPVTAIQKRGVRSRAATAFEDERDMLDDNDLPLRSKPIRNVKSGRSQPEPLFVLDSEPDDLMEVGTLKGSDEDIGPTRSAPGGAKRKAVVLADSDSDDNLGFRGPSKKKTRR